MHVAAKTAWEQYEREQARTKSFRARFGQSGVWLYKVTTQPIAGPPTTAAAQSKMRLAADDLQQLEASLSYTRALPRYRDTRSNPSF
jgi:hypothetical protein